MPGITTLQKQKDLEHLNGDTNARSGCYSLKIESRYVDKKAGIKLAPVMGESCSASAIPLNNPITYGDVGL